MHWCVFGGLERKDAWWNVADSRDQKDQTDLRRARVHCFPYFPEQLGDWQKELDRLKALQSLGKH